MLSATIQYSTLLRSTLWHAVPRERTTVFLRPYPSRLYAKEAAMSGEV